MSTATALPEQTEEQALSRERRENARRINVVRLWGVSALFALFVVLGGVLRQRAWQGNLVAFAGYWVATVAVWAGARRWTRAARLSSLSIAFLDMPMTFLLQFQTYPTTPNPGAVAGYSLGIFILLLFLGTLSLERWQIYVTAAAAIGLEGALQYFAGISIGAIVSTVILVSMAAAACAYANRRILRLIARVVEELRERQRARDALREAEEAKLRVEKLAAVGQLAAGIAHDLRNPLGSIRNAFFVLRRRIDKAGVTADPSAAEAVQIIEREIDASARILEDLLDFARRRAPQREPVKVRELVSDAVGIVPTVDRVQVLNEVPPDFPTALVDRGQFRQVLSNLIHNAVEAAAEKAGGTVKIAAETASQEVRISVRDDGPGIPAAQLERIFEPLFTTKKKGTGLGLAIVAGIVQQHSGEIRVESEVGKGTVFTIRLPVN